MNTTVQYPRDLLDNPKVVAGERAAILGTSIGVVLKEYRSMVVVRNPEIPGPTIWDMLGD